MHLVYAAELQVDFEQHCLTHCAGNISAHSAAGLTEDQKIFGSDFLEQWLKGNMQVVAFAVYLLVLKSDPQVSVKDESLYSDLLYSADGVLQVEAVETCVKVLLLDLCVFEEDGKPYQADFVAVDVLELLEAADGKKTAGG